MKRRKFLLSSGTALLGSTAVTSVNQEPVLGLNFDLVGTESIQPSNADSILVNFQNFELVPRYIDETAGDATVTITLDVDGFDSVENQTTVSFENGVTKDESDLGSAVPIVLDGVDTSENALDGSVTISVDHPSVSDSYSQSFTITDDPLQEGLVGWWPLHEWSGRANDISTNKNYGTVNGCTQGVVGRGGLTSYNFDGSNPDTINFGNPSDIDFESSDFTICAWIKPEDTGTKRFVWHKWRPNLYITSDTSIQFEVSDDAGKNSFLQYDNVNLNGGKWYFAVQRVKQNQEHSSFLFDENGLVGERSESISSVTGSSSYDLLLSRKGWSGSGNSYYSGNVSNFRIYDRYLSENEIQDLYDISSGDYTSSSLHNGTDSGVSRWRFDSGSVTADDWSTNSLTNNASGSGISSDAIKGDAKQFDNNEYMEASVEASTDMTVSAWVNPDQLGTDSEDDYIFSLIEDVGNRFCLLLHNGSGSYSTCLFVGGNGEGPLIKGGSVNIEGWTHCVSTVDQESIKLYVNGVLVGEESHSKDPSVLSSPVVRVGRLNTNGYYLDGKIDDVRIYNRVLSALEIQQLYQWGTRGKDLRGRTTTLNKSDMIGWWKLNETSGSTAYDSSGNGYNGSVNGAGPDGSDTTTGPKGNTAFNFDGQDDYIYIGDKSVYDGAEQISIMTWVNAETIDENNNEHIVGKDGSNTDAWYIKNSNSGEWDGNIHDGSNSSRVSSTSKTVTGEWVHLGLTYDGTSTTLYVNGIVEDTDTTASGSIYNTSNPLTIGTWDDGSDLFFNGSISDVRIYNRALTPQEVSYLYEQKF